MSRSLNSTTNMVVFVHYLANIINAMEGWVLIMTRHLTHDIDIVTC